MNYLNNIVSLAPTFINIATIAQYTSDPVLLGLGGVAAAALRIDELPSSFGSGAV